MARIPAVESTVYCTKNTMCPLSAKETAHSKWCLPGADRIAVFFFDFLNMNGSLFP